MRYDRQELIPMWNQQSLTKMTVTVIGTGLLAQMVVMGLASLGVGEIYIIGAAQEQNENSCSHPGLLSLVDIPEGGRWELALAKFAERINPEIRAVGLRTRLVYEESLSEIPISEAIINASNDSDSNSVTFHKQCQGAYCLNGLAGSLSGAFYPNETVNWQRIKAYGRMRQGIVPSLAVAGLILEELRQLMMYWDSVPCEEIYFSPRFDGMEPEGDFTRLQSRHIILAGGGALGTFLAVGLALEGFTHVTVVDPDIVEGHNLNRQSLYYDAIGEKKAPVLAEAMNKLAGRSIADAVTERVETLGSVIDQSKDMILLAAVDNMSARGWMSDTAVHNGHIFISGGTGPFSGQSHLYIPGKTRCLRCRLDPSTFEQEAAPATCADREPSVIMSNMIVAAFMLGQLFLAAESNNGIETRRTAVYDSRDSARIALFGPFVHRVTATLAS